MRRSRTVAVLGITAMIALGACSSSDSSSDNASGGTSADITTTTCADGDTIGVALPAQTSENWTLAKDEFVKGLTDAGYKPDVQFADASSGAASQQQKVDNMLTAGAKVVVIGAEDGKQLGTQVSTAESQGVPVVAYDRAIDAPGVDYYIAFDNFKVGQLQGQALLDGMAALKGASPWNIELFAGALTDSNAPVFFNGAMDVLQPKIDDGTVVVVSGETSLQQVATEGWKGSEAQKRMENLVTQYYNDGTELDGVLSPNDQLAQGILQATLPALTPVVTGQDSEVAAVERIARGEQYASIYKDTRLLVADTVAMVQEICGGDVATTTDEFTTEGGVTIATKYLEPKIVTKENAAEVYKDNPELSAAFANAS